MLLGEQSMASSIGALASSVLLLTKIASAQGKLSYEAVQQLATEELLEQYIHTRCAPPPHPCIAAL